MGQVVEGQGRAYYRTFSGSMKVLTRGPGESSWFFENF